MNIFKKIFGEGNKKSDITEEFDQHNIEKSFNNPVVSDVEKRISDLEILWLELRNRTDELEILWLDLQTGPQEIKFPYTESDKPIALSPTADSQPSTLPNTPDILIEVENLSAVDNKPTKLTEKTKRILILDSLNGSEKTTQELIKDTGIRDAGTVLYRMSTPKNNLVVKTEKGWCKVEKQ